MEDLLNDGIPSIDGRSPYIDVSCKVKTLVSLNLAVHTKISNNEKRIRIVTMMGKYVNTNHNQIFKQAMHFIRDHTKVPYFQYQVPLSD